MFRTVRLSMIIAALFVTMTACSSDDGAGGGGTPVDVTLTDTSASVSPASTAAGAITFAVKNDGGATHELYVFKTELDPDALPVEEGKVSESGEGVEFIAEVEDIAPGTTGQLDVDLAAGSYALLCNIPGHYEAGIRTGFTVT
jgi:uncharacterized cupredoxin-like copper-binding protein